MSYRAHPKRTLSMEFGSVSPLPFPSRQHFPVNCYGYALHVAAWLEPGSYYEGNETSTPKALIAALESDGLVREPRRAFVPTREHIIAAYLDASSDFHFARLDKTGLWSQMIVNKGPTAEDFAGNPIVSPETADMREYSFVGYFSVPQDIRPLFIQKHASP